MFNPKRDALTYSLTELKRMKDEKLVSPELLRVLREKADAILELPTITVTKRKLKAPSGNPHDYMSMGPYWWPNPDTPNGLPYIRRDGEINPETKEPNSFGTMLEQVKYCSLAAFYFEDDRYAKRAVDAIYDWYINPETYMNPNARYAQAIPGICDGRCIGLIDFNSSYIVMDSVRLLEAMGKIDPEIVKALENWYIDFTNWMLTNEIGIEEDLTTNNHATYYDVQILASAIFTGRSALAKKIITTAYGRRFKTQIMNDGSQPHELARTNAMGYSYMNMKGFTAIALMAEKLGDNRFWQVDKEEGDCLLKLTMDYLYQFIVDPDSFKYQQIHGRPTRYPDAVDMLRVLEVRFPGMGYGERANTLKDDNMLGLLTPAK